MLMSEESIDRIKNNCCGMLNISKKELCLLYNHVETSPLEKHFNNIVSVLLHKFDCEDTNELIYKFREMEKKIHD